MTPARSLIDLGLRPYEAKTLLALMEIVEGNSAKLAEVSGVPRTSMYEVCRSLVAQGLAEEVATTGVARWRRIGSWADVHDRLANTERARSAAHLTRLARFYRDLQANG